MVYIKFMYIYKVFILSGNNVTSCTIVRPCPLSPLIDDLYAVSSLSSTCLRTSSFTQVIRIAPIGSTFVGGSVYSLPHCLTL